MGHYLLTGAGFSRNWGGWLADEAFEYLLGYPGISQDIHMELWKSKNQRLGFENTLQALRQAAEKHKDDRFVSNVRLFERMLEDMFNAMNVGFKQVVFNPLPPGAFNSDDPVDFIRRFLTHFDAIFTLNQDCLLELKYNAPGFHRISQNRWRDMYCPGLEEVLSSGKPFEPPGVYKPGSKTFSLDRDRQPYFKLHGSSNWREGNSSLLIMGGNKGPDIEKHWLLRNYRDQFTNMITRGDARLVIIGYSFLDAHINEIVETAANAGGKIFIIDPLGIDVLNNAPKVSNDARGLQARIYTSIAGGSRRLLSTTFSSDHVERNKVWRFLNRLGPGH
jgi:hypothetical protein